MAEKSGIDHEKLLMVLKYAFPEMEELLPLRFSLLSAIKFNQPIGRRALSGGMGYTERVVRRECDVLKDNDLIGYFSDGMRITDRGAEVLEGLSDIFYRVGGIASLEKSLAEALNISRVIIGSVGYQSPEAALQEVGVEAARYLHRIINPKTIIGLTGGSSIEAVINGYKIDWGGKAFEVIPARGGLGNKAEHQANTLAERLAGKLGADYQLLYTQDNFSKSTIEELKNEPNIIKILEAIDEIDILLFGVGRADVMASRRSLEQSEIDDILRKGAVAESFGYYFNQNGDIVHEISTIGIGLNKYKSLKSAIAVAADVNKAEAIIAISKLNPNLVLVTDEQTALKIQEYFN